MAHGACIELQIDFSRHGECYKSGVVAAPKRVSPNASWIRSEGVGVSRRTGSTKTLCSRQYR